MPSKPSDLQPLYISVAKLETTSEYVAETLERIEAKLDAVIGEQVETGTRVTKLESDVAWGKKVSAPIITVIGGVVLGWAKGFLGIQ